MFNVQPSFILLLLVTANSQHEIFYWDCSFMTGKSAKSFYALCEETTWYEPLLPGSAKWQLRAGELEE